MSVVADGSSAPSLWNQIDLVAECECLKLSREPVAAQLAEANAQLASLHALWTAAQKAHDTNVKNWIDLRVLVKTVHDKCGL